MEGDMCSTNECGRKALARGLCSRCYQRARKAGDLDQHPSTWRHELTEVNVEEARAHCKTCGPTDIKVGSSRRRHECMAAVREWRSSASGRAASRRSQLKRKYGLTENEFAAMAEEQGGVCAICSDPVSLVVDHDHGTGAVRGLLCNPCNVGLGFFRDDRARLANALEYLRKD